MLRSAVVGFPVVAALVSFIPGPTDAAPNIAGGTTADIKDFPYQVAVILKRGQVTYQCGGSIINSQWVLTAGHCFYQGGQPRTDPNEVEIRHGASNLDSPSMKVARADKVVLHPQFQYVNGQPSNDIALVKIWGRIAADAVNLDEQSDPTGDAVLSGWGATPQDAASNALSKATLPLVPTARCNDSDHYRGAVTAGMICAGFPRGGVTSCEGDSGGPLVQVRDGVRYQVGIVSLGLPDCSTSAQSLYSVFTRVSYYRDWINSVIRQAVLDRLALIRKYNDDLRDIPGESPQERYDRHRRAREMLRQLQEGPIQ